MTIYQYFEITDNQHLQSRIEPAPTKNFSSPQSIRHPEFSASNISTSPMSLQCQVSIGTRKHKEMLPAHFANGKIGLRVAKQPDTAKQIDDVPKKETKKTYAP